MIQTKSLEAIKAIQVSNSRSSNLTLIRCIHHLLKNVANWALEYISREENRKTDRMAKIIFNKKEGLQLFVENPFVLVQFIVFSSFSYHKLKCSQS